MQWLVIYTKDFDQTRQQQIIAASTYTQAYLNFILKYDGAILEIKQI